MPKINGKPQNAKKTEIFFWLHPWSVVIILLVSFVDQLMFYMSFTMFKIDHYFIHHLQF